MSGEIQIKPGDKIKIKRIGVGVGGRAIVEKMIAEGEIKEIRPLSDDLAEPGKIVLDIGGTTRTFLISSGIKIELV